MHLFAGDTQVLEDTMWGLATANGGGIAKRVTSQHTHPEVVSGGHSNYTNTAAGGAHRAIQEHYLRW